MNRRPLLLVLPLAAALTGCQQVKSANPLSPLVAGPMAGVSISTPQTLSPGTGLRLDDEAQPFSLVVSNPETNSERTVTISLQVAFDSGFSSLAISRSGIAPAGNGQTTVRLDRLPAGRTYYWRTKADDGANDSGWSAPAYFEILNPVVIGIPNPRSPVGNVKLTSTAPILVVTNGKSSGPFTPLSYQFQVSDGTAFANLMANGYSSESSSGETQFVAPAVGSPDQTLFWRARIYDSKRVGEWSRVESFRVATPVIAPSPAPPAPGGGGNPGLCGPPALFDALPILQCIRSQFGGMNHSTALQFLSAAAKALNAAKVPGSPFGLLRKTSGNNCGGYSCDILCAGQGTAQLQWDVLINEDVPTWGSPNGYSSGIRVDVCEVQ